MKPVKYPEVADVQKAIKNGDAVIFTDDFGRESSTKARSDAYQIAKGNSNEGMWAIFIDGKTGYYELDRVRPAGTKPLCCGKPMRFTHVCYSSPLCDEYKCKCGKTVHTSHDKDRK